uniref:Uncharacterized protein n=1 Tax=Salix viminalis TaxID=40686 RepID=A0A6N2MUX5_SALVM
MFKPDSSSTTIPATTTGSTFVTMSDLEEMVKQTQDSQTGQILGTGRKDLLSKLKMASAI